MQRALGFLLAASAALAADGSNLLPSTMHWEFPADIATDQYRELREFYSRVAAQTPVEP